MVRYPLIVLEGIDGSGKATHSRKLCERLKNVFETEPITRLEFPQYESTTGRLIQAHLQEKWTVPDYHGGTEATVADELTFQALMTVNRYEMADEIETLRQWGPVVLDRYWPSGYAYGTANGLDPDWLLRVHACLPQPDVCLLIDIPPEVSWERRPTRRDRYEKKPDLLKQARFNYHYLFSQMSHQYPNWFIIPVDGKDSVETVQDRIWARLPSLKQMIAS